MDKKESVVLEKLKFGFNQMISEEAIEDMYLQEATLKIIKNEMFENYIIAVRSFIWSEPLQEVIVKCPATWWEAFKKEKMPKWILRKLKPIKYITEVIKVYAVYPKLAVMKPDEKFNFIINKIKY